MMFYVDKKYGFYRVNHESVSFMFVVKNLPAADEQKLVQSIQSLASKLSLQNIDVTTMLPSREAVINFIERSKSAGYLD